MRLNQDELAGVQAISTLLAAAHVPTRASLAVVRCGLKLSQMIAMRVAGGYRERR
jgi:hypothetical protein